MKPPICEVCGDRFDPATGRLVTFLATAASDAFDKRAEQPGFVGHRPNTGWFCSAHVDQARRYAALMTRSAAVQEIRDTAASEVAREDQSTTEALRSGALQATDEASTAIVWQLAPVKNSAVLQVFLDLVPVLFTMHGLSRPPALEVSSRRNWNPIDGAQPPDCPYDDQVRHEALASDGRPLVSVHSDQAHWNDNDISNVASHLFVNVHGCRVSAWASGSGDHDACTSLTLRRPVSEPVVDALGAAFAKWLGPASS